MTNREIRIGNCVVGDNAPVFIIAEIGINHNGDINIAKKLIDVASFAGCDAVKFQKRTPEICVPEERKNVMLETPWGRISYSEYREKVEFALDEYKEIDRYCREKDILWTASCWDVPSLDFIEKLSPHFHKVPSAQVTNIELLKHYKTIGKPLLVSTGMSSMNELEKCAEILGKDIPWIFLHCTSTYPAKTNELNLRCINSLEEKFKRMIGYSGHEVGLQITYAAVVMGAVVVERHITLDRSMWGSDQAASIEPGGLIRLVRDIRIIEEAMGDGLKRVYESELPIRKKLRYT